MSAGNLIQLKNDEEELIDRITLIVNQTENLTARQICGCLFSVATDVLNQERDE